jgi:hypothetical protein
MSLFRGFQRSADRSPLGNDDADIVLPSDLFKTSLELNAKILDFSGVSRAAGVVKQRVMIISLACVASGCGSFRSARAESRRMDPVQAAAANSVPADEVQTFGNVESEEVRAVLQKMPLSRMAPGTSVSSEL